MSQVTTTLVKPATKPARARTATKPVVVKAPTLAFFVQDFARPRGGSALFAHTQAFLELSGIADGKAYPRAKAEQVIGKTAVKYHLANGNLTATKDGLKMSDKGYMFFSARPTVDAELHAAYTAVMTTGCLNDKANVKVAIAVAPVK